jgi:hypothetical protein
VRGTVILSAVSDDQLKVLVYVLHFFVPPFTKIVLAIPTNTKKYLQSSQIHRGFNNFIVVWTLRLDHVHWIMKHFAALQLEQLKQHFIKHFLDCLVFLLLRHIKLII